LFAGDLVPRAERLVYSAATWRLTIYFNQPVISAHRFSIVVQCRLFDYA